MPMLRWFGFKGRWSLPAIDSEPAVGVSKPAIILSTVVLPQPDGPRKETNSPFSMCMVKSCTTCTLPNDFLMLDSSRNAMGADTLSLGRSGSIEAGNELEQPHAEPGHGKCDHREGRRLIGLIGADKLQVGTKSRSAEQRGHGEFADDDRK